MDQQDGERRRAEGGGGLGKTARFVAGLADGARRAGTYPTRASSTEALALLADRGFGPSQEGA